MPIFELSSKKKDIGKRKFKASLYELKSPNCVLNGKGSDFNKNGLTLLEEYAKDNLDSIPNMSATVEFLDETRTAISEHGYTGIIDKKPTFNNATVVGHFTNAYIDTIEIKGEMTKCVIGEGYLDELRYPDFVNNLENLLLNGFNIDGSVEIFASKYLNDYKGEGRVPIEFSHMGWAFVLCPADRKSTLLELNNKNDKINKEEHIMNEEQIMQVVQKTITSALDNSKDIDEKMVQLQSDISSKDKTIQDLNAELESCKKELENTKQKEEKLNKTIEEKDVEINSYKEKEAIANLENALSAYSENEIKYAEVEINSFKENPLESNINDIVSKICVEIVKARKDEKKQEIEINNIKKDVDIFCGVDDITDEEEKDISIF